jgi:hypothetical protein
MAPVTFALHWPRSKLRDETVKDALRYREGHGVLTRGGNCKIQVYITTVWDTDSEELVQDERTILPACYKPFWDQLNYAAIVLAHTYEWLIKHVDDTETLDELHEAVTYCCQNLVYTCGVRKKIKTVLLDEDVSKWDKNTRIPIFDEWIIKDAFDLHDATPAVLRQKINAQRFSLDPFRDRKELGKSTAHAH